MRERASTENEGLEVVMVGPKTFPPEIGGIETHVYEISRRLVKRGVEVRVIVPGRPRGAPREEIVEGVHLVRTAALDNRFAIKLSGLPGLLAELKREPGTLIHAHDAVGGFAAAAFRNPRSFVYTMHGIAFDRSDWGTPFRQGIKLMQTLALRRARHVFCTDERAARFASTLRAQTEILSNGVDADKYRSATSPRPEEFGDAFVVLYVGRLASGKGIRVLLEAIRRMPPDVRKRMLFAFIGDGPLYDDVRRAAGSFPEIRMLGRVRHAEIHRYLVHADAFVLPSLSEGMPLALLEAMAASLPCVVSDVGGISRQVPSDGLVLFPPGDPSKLADALVRLSEDPSFAADLGDKARHYAERLFSWETIVDRLLQVYRDISGAR